ncbi:hypothetical protein APA_1205 [Pseudanabaena sp. lw0831]|nr:hypothetical protein APA_1205 [Pseudanabaena sp. lw0831]
MCSIPAINYRLIYVSSKLQMIAIADRSQSFVVISVALCTMLMAISNSN